MKFHKIHQSGLITKFLVTFRKKKKEDDMNNSTVFCLRPDIVLRNQRI